MKNQNLYVGTREPQSKFQNILNRDIYHLNEGLSKNLRTSVMKKGIKKTEQGKKLMFFSVYSSELQNLLNNGLEILVKVDGDYLSNKLQEINSNFPQKMSYDLSLKYKTELEKGFLDSIEVVGKDKNIRETPITDKNYLNRNTPLGRLIYNTDGYKWGGEIGEYFDYLFHKGYVKGFSYSNPSQGMKSKDDKSLEFYTWETTNCPTHKILEEYQNCYRFLIQWSFGDKYSKVYLSDFKGNFTSSQSWSDDGYRYRTQLETSQPLKELYDEFKKQYNSLDFTDSLMNNYSPYGFWGCFFEDYQPITWDECRKTYEKIFVPIIKEIEGEDCYLGYDTVNREKMRDILLSKRGKNWIDLEHGLWVKKFYLKEDVSKQNIVDLWWNDKKYLILSDNPKISQNELEKKREEYNKFSWSSESRLEEIYVEFNSIEITQI